MLSSKLRVSDFCKPNYLHENQTSYVDGPQVERFFALFLPTHCCLQSNLFMAPDVAVCNGTNIVLLIEYAVSHKIILSVFKRDLACWIASSNVL